MKLIYFNLMMLNKSIKKYNIHYKKNFDFNLVYEFDNLSYYHVLIYYKKNIRVMKQVCYHI